MSTLMERANKLKAEGVFLGGGPVELFETAGRKQLITLLSEGLTPSSKVLDIGCGCLRGGYWLIHFLDSWCYFGIEPNVDMLEAGVRVVLEEGLADFKKPRFDHNTNFDFTVFNQKFDFVVARSVWSHASRQQIQTMLDGFVRSATDEGIFLVSYNKTRLFSRSYHGTEWIGRSDRSETPGFVNHSFRWIRKECASRKLIAEEITERAYNFRRQRWIKITRQTT